MKPRVILDSKKFSLTIDRLCYQLIENHKDFKDSAIIGLQTSGIYLANRLYKRLKEISGPIALKKGSLDITFYRDDFRKSSAADLTPSSTDIMYTLEGKRIILVDDVLYTGRTIRAALDALMDYGRPDDIELLVMVDRRLTRNVPIQAKYIGKTVDSINSERVNVKFEEVHGVDEITINSEKSK